MVVASDMEDPSNNEVVAMEEPKYVCSICAATDVRMHNIGNTKLQALYELLADAQHDEDDGSPKVVCYMCYPLLAKCGKFSDMINVSERLHNNINGIETNDIKPTPLLGNLSRSEVKFMVIDTKIKPPKPTLKDLIVFEDSDTDDENDATVKEEITIDDERLIGKEVNASDLIDLPDDDDEVKMEQEDEEEDEDSDGLLTDFNEMEG